MIDLLVLCSVTTLRNTEQFPTKPPAIRRLLSKDALAIFSAIVTERLASKGEAPAGTYLVVANQTLTFCPGVDESQLAETCIFPAFSESILDATVLPVVPRSLKSRLLQENLHSVPVPALNIAAARLVPRRRITEMFSGSGGWWPAFYKRFPDSRGFLEVTKPVFTDDNQNALVYVSHSCGGLCGTGWLMYLSRDGKTWRITDKRMLWIS